MLTQNTPTTLDQFEAKVDHHFAKGDGTSIHYASLGDGPLIVFLHGFPDHWLTWWKQMDALSQNYQTAALDMRGYNLSAQPDALESYAAGHLVQDVLSVIEHCGHKQAIVVGHDWGGHVAWQLAMTRPEYLSKLAIVNMPHPWAIYRELANNPDQQQASAYVRLFQQEQAHLGLDFSQLSTWIKDPEFKERHLLAMSRSNPNAMLNYYRKCFPAPPYEEKTEPPQSVLSPTLVIHGLEDPYALPSGLNGLWQWVNAPLTLKTLPNVGHFVQQDAPDELTKILSVWLESED
ncbi:alpha/beta fold hydrolase [Flexibacterium corallicola]|uniref:alpha/beta fold hydrolase n=1 Tax=Flexibacterium corallicola TaxID=3037259 RepID=UPI00286F834F|nr:alpha/beta hydrolase [Pseudovibrio sp. M1P-2-3]